MAWSMVFQRRSGFRVCSSISINTEGLSGFGYTLNWSMYYVSITAETKHFGVSRERHIRRA